MIGRYLDVSTGHITEREAEELTARSTRSGAWPLLDKYEYGAWIVVGDEDSPDDAEDHAQLPNVLRLVQHARNLGCAWLRLDSDGDYLDGFPVFDW